MECILFSRGGKMKQVMALALMLVLAASALAAAQDATAVHTGGSKKKPHARTAAVAVSQRLDTMQQAIDAQQQQIQQLRQEVQSRDTQIQQLQQQNDQVQNAAAQAGQKADAAASQASEQQQAVVAVRSDVSDLKLNVTNTALTLQETQKNLLGLESPLALHYKGITITPGGFLAAETVWRRGATGSDVNTPFNSIPFPGSSQSHLSEFYASGRQSRVSMLAEGKLSSAKLTGYVEADFLSGGITST